MGNCNNYGTVLPYESASLVVIEEISPQLVDVCRTSWMALTGDACLIDAIPNSPKLDTLCAEVLSRLVAFPDVYGAFRPRRSFNRPMLIYRLVRYILSVKDSSLKIKRQLRSMGRNHMRIGVTEQQIMTFNEVFLKAYQSQLGHKSSRRVISAWKSLLMFVTEQFFFDKITFIAHFTKDPVSALAPVSAMRRNSEQLRSESFHSNHSISINHNNNNNTNASFHSHHSFHNSAHKDKSRSFMHSVSYSNYNQNNGSLFGLRPNNSCGSYLSGRMSGCSGDADEEITFFESQLNNYHNRQSSSNNHSVQNSWRVAGSTPNNHHNNNGLNINMDLRPDSNNLFHIDDHVTEFNEYFETCHADENPDTFDELDAPITVHECQRLKTLYELKILDTSQSDPEYDAFTALAAAVFKVRCNFCTL
jgi:hypothetical protein